MFYKLSYLPTLLKEVLELSTFVVHEFLATLYKISHNSLQFSSINVVNFVTDIKFQFFQSAWVCLLHSIFQSIWWTLMEFLHLGIVFQRVFVLGLQTELTSKYTLFSRKYSFVSHYTLYTYTHIVQYTRKTEWAPSHSATIIWLPPWMRETYSHMVESAHISSPVSPCVSLCHRTYQSPRLLANAMLISL